MKNWLLRIGAKIIAPKVIALQDGTTKEVKNFWQSKALWGAILLTAKVGLEAVSEAMGHPIKFPESVEQIAIALGIWGLRTSKKDV